MARGKKSKKIKTKVKKKGNTKKKGGVYQMGGATTVNYTATYSNIDDGIKVTKMTGAGQIHKIEMKGGYLFFAIDNMNPLDKVVNIVDTDKLRLLTADELDNINASKKPENPEHNGWASSNPFAMGLSGLIGAIPAVDTPPVGSILKYNAIKPVGERVSLMLGTGIAQGDNSVPILRMIVGADTTHSGASADAATEVKTATPANDKATYILVVNMSAEATHGRGQQFTARV